MRSQAKCSFCGAAILKESWVARHEGKCEQNPAVPARRAAEEEERRAQREARARQHELDLATARARDGEVACRWPRQPPVEAVLRWVPPEDDRSLGRFALECEGERLRWIGGGAGGRGGADHAERHAGIPCGWRWFLDHLPWELSPDGPGTLEETTTIVTSAPPGPNTRGMSSHFRVTIDLAARTFSAAESHVFT